jgi:hypothetical protein
MDEYRPSYPCEEADMEEITEEGKKPFIVDNDEKADWAARIVKEEYAERDRLLALVESERERLDAREKEIKERYIRNTDYLETQLISYMATVKTRDTPTQSSYALLNAKLVYKKPKMDIQPGEALVGWLEANHPELVKVEKKPDWAAVKKNVIMLNDGVYAMSDTGEIVDGIVPKEVPAKFEVK